MKKLNKLILNNKAVKMTIPQMKNITGGYDLPGAGDCIMFNCHCDSNGENVLGLPWSWTACVQFSESLQMGFAVCRTGGYCERA